MKSFLSLLLAGLIGGLVCYGALQWSGAEIFKNQQVQQVSYANSPVTTGPDFAMAAEIAQKAVVLIEAAESKESAQQRYRQQDPMQQWLDRFGFGSDMFGFGPLIRKGAGSGVIISKDGYILTNNHVVDFADELLVKVKDGKEYQATVVGRDPSSDLAVIKIDAGNLNLPTLEYADSDKARVGEWVLAVGNPFEYLTSTVTAGIISAKGRDLNIIQGSKTIEQFIQTDAAINPGNSGGALVDAYGKLLGINTAIASETGSYAGYSFAIPVNLAISIANDIIKNGGDIERTSLGVEVFVLDEELAKEQGLKISEGLLVDAVGEKSAAQYAGILPNDVLVEIDGKKLTSFNDLKEKIDLAKVGDTINLKVYRQGKYLDIPVRLKKGL